MEVKILEQEKNRIKVKIIGEDHTLCNAIRKELWNDKDVEVSGYNIEHPLISEPILIVETKKGDPKKAIMNAIDRLKKRNKDFSDLAKNLK